MSSKTSYSSSVPIPNSDSILIDPFVTVPLDNVPVTSPDNLPVDTIPLRCSSRTRTLL